MSKDGNTEIKTEVKNSVGRMVFVVLAVLIQVGWIAFLVLKLEHYSVYVSLAVSILSLLLVLRIYGKHTNSAFKMPWIMLIMVLPFMGTILYLMTGRSGATKHMRERFEYIDKDLDCKLVQDEAVIDKLDAEDMGLANQCRYIRDFGKYPVYDDCDIEYFADASDGLASQLAELEKAEHFIFMEYHAIEDDISFKAVKDVLRKKVSEGVEVRILYDDVGSIGFINKDFIKRMEAEGIQCRVFNPIMPFLNIFMNNRDHRKITSIDGRVGFTGGYNLANEYFNVTHPYGQWKDTGVRIQGKAVKNLTEMFLEMWNAVKKTDDDYDRYLVETDYSSGKQGYVQPYADSPLDDETVGENVYMNIIKRAEKYVYFTTPYLIISDEMYKELVLAAKRGVDVRIITPGIPDKKLVFKITRSHYGSLVAGGVRIFEYTPGFIHSKMCIADDKTATVGTINLDWRSLYLHFENGVLLHKCDCIKDIKKDFFDTFEECEEVTEKYRSRSTALRAGQCMLRLISPLL